MFSFFKKKPNEKPETTAKNESLLSGLLKTKITFSSIFRSIKTLDNDTLEEIETILITADVGIETTTKIINHLKKHLDNDDWQSILKQQLRELLLPVSIPLDINDKPHPYVILVVGVNGAGKTTSIGKLAYNFRKLNHKVMLAAGDTFRAAAVEQLQQWGKQNGVPVIAQHTGADSASVIFDALTAAKARAVDVLIADTAGRLHTKDNLMTELQKVKRVLAKIDISAPHETLLILDAGTGQNALNQVTKFKDEIGITGLALTKLDGTAKGGIIFALADKFQLPIRFIGIGEKITDLKPFNADEFIESIFN